MKTKKEVWQRHHITYTPEKIVRVRRKEHYYITLLNRFKSLSAGAKRAIRYILRVKPVVRERK